MIVMEEIWKPIIIIKDNITIDLSDRYIVSNLGRIKNIKRNYILKSFGNKAGYKLFFF